MRDAALDGLGLAYMPADQIEADTKSGRLKAILPTWTPPLPGYHLYYANRHHASPAFKLFVEAVRYRAQVK